MSSKPFDKESAYYSLPICIVKKQESDGGEYIAGVFANSKIALDFAKSRGYVNKNKNRGFYFEEFDVRKKLYHHELETLKELEEQEI